MEPLAGDIFTGTKGHLPNRCVRPNAARESDFPSRPTCWARTYSMPKASHPSFTAANGSNSPHQFVHETTNITNGSVTLR
jgi:hypothetical protein